MIISILLYLLSLFIDLMTAILPTWTVWPASLIQGLEYFCSSLAKLNFILPIDSLFAVILFLVNFFVLYLTAKLIMKVFNFFRGSGGIDL